MGIVVFLLLAVVAAAFIAYPLLPGRVPTPSKPAMTEAEIEQAVRDLRRTRQARSAAGTTSGPACASCGAQYKPGDTFCARCGSDLSGLACPSCGTSYHEGDLFCVRCGSSLPQLEAQPQAAELKCSNCGAALQEGDQFCAKCGQVAAMEESE